MRRTMLGSVAVGVIGALTGFVGGTLAVSTPAPYPDTCQAPVSFVSTTLAEQGEGVSTVEQAVPAEVRDDVGDPEVVDGDFEFQTPEGELFIVSKLGGGYALVHMRVCGGEIGDGAAG